MLQSGLWRKSGINTQFYVVEYLDKMENLSSGSSSISTSAVEGIIDHLKRERKRNSTRTNYYCVWKNFNEFYIKLDRKPESWEERLTLFVGYLVETNKKATTIRSYISAIKAVLMDDGICLNEDRYLLNSLTRACRFKNNSVRTRLPIRKPLLTLMIRSLPRIFDSDQPYLVCMYRALMITAYYGLFRVGELCFTKQTEHAVKAKDVHVGRNKRKMMFILRTSKTHWSDKKPQVIKINGLDYDVTGKKITGKQSKNCGDLCPFNLIQKYLEVRGKRKSETEQFFIFKDYSPVTAVHYRCILRRILTSLDLDASLNGTHGTRTGFALDLLETGSDVRVIMKLGRWQSNAVFNYLNNQ